MKPSERITKIFDENNYHWYSEQERRDTMINAIMVYLDEEYEKNNQ